MHVRRAGSTPTELGPPEHFTGEVRLEMPFAAEAPARVRGATVHFAPGARTVWHTHPLGQSLLVTAGEGRIQCWGGPLEVLRLGDQVWIPPGEKHWHGAAPDQPMSHVAVQEAEGGRAVDWLEPVTEAQYLGLA